MLEYGVFSGPYFLVFSPNTGKYGPEKTPYLETFLAHSAIFTKKVHHRCLTAEVYSEPNQTSKMELFAKTVNGFHPLTIFARSSMLDARLGGF